MRSLSSEWGRGWSLTADEVGQRAGSSGSGWEASAGEVWKQEGEGTIKGELDQGTVAKSSPSSTETISSSSS